MDSAVASRWSRCAAGGAPCCGRTPGCRGWHRHPTCRRRTPRASIRAAASTRAPISRKGAAPRARSNGSARRTSRRTRTLSYVLMIAVAPRPTLFAPGRFFVHPIFDYFLIGGGLSLVFAVAMATVALDLTLNGLFATLIIVANGAHFAASTVRLYTRPGVTRALPLLTLAFPVLAVLAVTAAITLPEPLGLLLVATYL